MYASPSFICRVPANELRPPQIDVQIATHHLLDHIEWDLLSPLTPEDFAQKLCADVGLAGEAAPLVAHALHEEILRHKKDAIEWGVIGGDVPSSSRDIAEEAPRDKSGLGLVKDKTGLGLGGWGRTPKDGRGPKALRSVWKDWSEAEEFATRFEVLSAEEVERREIERERASRCAFASLSERSVVFASTHFDLFAADGFVGRRQNSSIKAQRRADGDDGDASALYIVYFIGCLNVQHWRSLSCSPAWTHVPL